MTGWFCLLFLVTTLSTNRCASFVQRQLLAEEPTEIKIALVNATILTMTDQGTVLHGTLLVRGSKIDAIGGPDLPVPEGYQRIDAAGGYLTPGLIDSRSSLWLDASDREASASDGSLSIRDAIDPFDENWPEVLSAGVTAVYLQPSSRGSIGGRGILLSTWPDDSSGPKILSDTAGLQMSMGSSRSNRERFQRYNAIKGWLQGLVDYKKKWDDYESSLKKAESESSAKETKEPAKEPSDPAKPSEKTAEKPPAKPEKDSTKEQMLPLLAGKMPVRLEVHGINDLRYAEELMKGFPDVQWVLESLDELGPSTNDLTKTSTPIVLQPIADAWFSGKSSALQSTSNYPVLLQTHPGAVAIGSFTGATRGSKSLRAVAASAVAAGMPPDRALHAITSVPAKLMQVEQRLGTLASGKDATFVLFHGHPLDLTAPVRRVFTEGIDRTKELELALSQPARPVPGETTAKAQNVAAVGMKSLPDRLPESYEVESTQVWIDGRFVHAVVHVQQGKIASVQKFVTDGSTASSEASSKTIASNAVARFHLEDLPITPGLISPFATLGVANNAIAGVESNSLPIQTRDAIDGANQAMERWGGSGFYHVALTAPPSNTIAGQIDLISTVAPEVSPSGPVAIEFVLSESARNPGRFPSSLAGQIQMLQELFGAGSSETRLFLPEVVSTWWRETSRSKVAKLRDRSLVSLFVVRDGAELDACIRLTKQWELRSAVYGIKSIRDQIGALADSKATLILTPESEEDYRWYGRDMVDCFNKGVPFLFAGETGRDTLRAAAECVRAGVPEEVVLKQLIDAPAALFQTDRPQLRVGDDADFVVWTGGLLTGHAPRPRCIVRGALYPAEKADSLPAWSEGVQR